MNNQQFPIVPFGKYKDRPVTDLLNDPEYLNWCKKQSWFEKYTIIYNICVNQTIQTNNINACTPEHNKLQNKFLDKKFQLDFINIIYPHTYNNIKQLVDSPDFKLYFKNQSYKFEHSVKNSRTKFEEDFNWNVTFYYRGEQKIILQPDDEYELIIKEKYREEYYLELNKQYDMIIDKFNEENMKRNKNYRSELNNYTKGLLLKQPSKPLEPVLNEIMDINGNICRKYRWSAYCTNCELFKKNHAESHEKIFETTYEEHMKNIFINIFNGFRIDIHRENNKFNIIFIVGENINIFCELKTQLGEDYPNVLRKMKLQKKLTIKNQNIFGYCKYEFCLIIENLNLITTTTEELITIFNQSKIKIFFIDRTKIYDTTSEKNKLIKHLKDKNNENDKLIKHLKDKIIQLEFYVIDMIDKSINGKKT